MNDLQETDTSKDERKPRHTTRRWLKWSVVGGINLGAVALLALVFLSVTDAYIEAQRAQMLVFAPHPLRRFVIEPGQTWTHGNARITINKHGMRGVAPILPKPDGTLRITAHGGSSTFDNWLSDGRSWPENLSTWLGRHGFSNVESLNAGIPGYSSRETLALYRDKVRYFQPSVAILYQGWNDAKYMRHFENCVDVDSYFRVRTVHLGYQFLTAERPWRNWYALRRMISEAGSEEANLGERAQWLAGVHPFDCGRKAEAVPEANLDLSFESRVERWRGTAGLQFWRGNVEDFARAVHRDGGLPVLVTQATLASEGLSETLQKKIPYDFVRMEHENLLALNEAMTRELAAVAQQLDTPFIDLRSRMNGVPGYFADHVHLTPQGSEFLARTLADELAVVLKDRDMVTPGEPSDLTPWVARWRFSPEGVVDDGSFGIAGALQGSATIKPDCHDGKPCLELPSEGAELHMDRSEYLHLSDSFAISAWIKPTRAVAPNMEGIAVKGGSYHFGLLNGRLGFKGYGLSSGKNWVASEVPVKNGAWQRVELTNRNGRLAMHLDGKTVLHENVTGTLQKTSRPLILGGGMGSFEGLIDDVQIKHLWGEDLRSPRLSEKAGGK